MTATRFASMTPARFRREYIPHVPCASGYPVQIDHIRRHLNQQATKKRRRARPLPMFRGKS